MRLPSHLNRRSSLDSETMTPMIDVVFLLLVFFVCASIGQTPDQLLPAALDPGTTTPQITTEDTTPEPWDHQQVRVRVGNPAAGSSEPAVQLNEQPLSGMLELKSRLNRLAEADPLSLVILDIGDQVPVQHFISVYDLCQALKFQKISFATRTRTPGRAD